MIPHTHLRPWLITYAIFLIIIVIETMIDYRPVSPTVEPSTFDQDAAMAYSTPDASVVTKISTRPLFEQDRRPKTNVEQGTPMQDAMPEPIPSHLLLEGVILSPQGRIALIRRHNAPEILLLHEGEAVDGWKLNEIHSESITLNKGARSHKLVLPHTQLAPE